MNLEQTSILSSLVSLLFMAACVDEPVEADNGDSLCGKECANKIDCGPIHGNAHLDELDCDIRAFVCGEFFGGEDLSPMRATDGTCWIFGGGVPQSFVDDNTCARELDLCSSE